MKKILFGLFIILFALPFFNCEPDDICEQGTPTTPKLIVEFYDNASPTVRKNVTNLGIVANGMTTGLLFSGVSKIQVPLKTDANTVSYDFILNSTSTTPAPITDKISINYTRKDVFISRACGYKTNFELNANPNGMVLNTPKNWIKEINIQKFTIENENETHVKIFF
ncbi:MAG: DUF6452 family protein [Limnohabitans sp.]|nr:DUF6452 family protein [Limnohabitans sp.]